MQCHGCSEARALTVSEALHKQQEGAIRKSLGGLMQCASEVLHLYNSRNHDLFSLKLKIPLSHRGRETGIESLPNGLESVLFS